MKSTACAACSRCRSSASGAPVSISQIADAEGLSPEYTAKLMRELRLGGLVESVRGAEGGYRLARPAEAISVWSALEVLGGAFFSEQFCECHGGPAAQVRARRATAGLRALWRAVQAALRETLSRIHLADLQRDERAMAAWLDPIRLVPLSRTPSSPSSRRIPDERFDPRAHRRPGQGQPRAAVHEGQPPAPAVRLLGAGRADPRHLLPEYRTVDVLADPEIRDGIKEYSSWPTIPQLYVAGEFQGGCDIVTEMYQSGELQQKLRPLG